MIAFIPLIVPLVPLIIGAGTGAVAVAACTSESGKRKAKIAKLKARIEALERKQP
jgi:precorrin-6B methylase 2